MKTVFPKLFVPVAEVKKAAAFIGMLIFKAQVGPAASAVIPNTQAKLLTDCGLRGVKPFLTRSTENRAGKQYHRLNGGKDWHVRVG